MKKIQEVSAPKSPEQRSTERAAKQRTKLIALRKAYEQNYRGQHRWLDEGKYFPHQNKRECASRVRQGL